MLKAQYETRGPVPQDVIHPVEFEEPTLESGQVLVEVLAAPINPSDVLTLTGEYGQLPPLPAVRVPAAAPRFALVSNSGVVTLNPTVSATYHTITIPSGGFNAGLALPFSVVLADHAQLKY